MKNINSMNAVIIIDGCKIVNEMNNDFYKNVL